MESVYPLNGSAFSLHIRSFLKLLFARIYIKIFYFGYARRFYGTSLCKMFCFHKNLFSDMDPLILDYTDVQLEVEVSGPEPSTSAAPPQPPTAAPHMLAPALTTNNHLSSLLLKDPTLQVQQKLYSFSPVLDCRFTFVRKLNLPYKKFFSFS
jgi:hypothetical protein